MPLEEFSGGGPYYEQPKFEQTQTGQGKLIIYDSSLMATIPARKRALEEEERSLTKKPIYWEGLHLRDARQLIGYQFQPDPSTAPAIYLLGMRELPQCLSAIRGDIRVYKKEFLDKFWDITAFLPHHRLAGGLAGSVKSEGFIVPEMILPRFLT